MIAEIIKKPENRRLELKREIPPGAKLAESVIAFSNGVGGDLYIGIDDKTRATIGIEESELFKTEEQISNIINDNCYPTIIPDIVVYNHEGKNIIKVKVYPGGQLPYYLKTKGKNKGTLIRVGSSNRYANEDILQELERRRRNISFDSVLSYDADFNIDLIKEFAEFYKKHTDKAIDKNALQTLQLIKEENENFRCTNAFLLLAHKDFKGKYFPFAKVECARFKGTTTETILDQATFEDPVFLQPDNIINFIKRNIAKSSKIGEIYRKDRWEYPIEALREAIINAVIHRDYSVLGSDIKVAIYDDMIELTNPGPLLPSINPEKLENNPSELRNRTLGPIFKECKLIEQWGTGFKKITDQLSEYPEIELKINEPSNSFQIQFLKNEYKPASIDPVVDPVADPVTDPVKKILSALGEGEKSSSELRNIVGVKHRDTFRKNYLHPALTDELIEYTVPEKPESRNQKYRLTKKGKQIFKTLNFEL